MKWPRGELHRPRVDGALREVLAPRVEVAGPGIVAELEIVEIAGKVNCHLRGVDRHLPLGARGVPAQDRVIPFLPGMVALPEDGAFDLIAQAVPPTSLNRVFRAADPDLHQVFLVRDRGLVIPTLTIVHPPELDAQRVLVHAHGVADRHLAEDAVFRNREIGVDRLGHIQAGVRVDDELDVEVANGPAALGPCRSLAKGAEGDQPHQDRQGV